MYAFVEFEVEVLYRKLLNVNVPRSARLGKDSEIKELGVLELQTLDSLTFANYSRRVQINKAEDKHAVCAPSYNHYRLIVYSQYQKLRIHFFGNW